MLTDHQWSPVAFILGQFHKRCLHHQSLKICLKITCLKFRSNFPGANELMSGDWYSNYKFYNMILTYLFPIFNEIWSTTIPHILIWIEKKMVAIRNICVQLSNSCKPQNFLRNNWKTFPMHLPRENLGLVSGIPPLFVPWKVVCGAACIECQINGIVFLLRKPVVELYEK